MTDDGNASSGSGGQSDRRSKRRRSVAYWVLASTLTIATLLPGLLLVWLSQTSDDNIATDAALGRAQLYIVSDRQQTISKLRSTPCRPAPICSPATAGNRWRTVPIKVVVEAYSHDGQPDLSVNIGMIYDGQGSSTASVAAEPRPRPSLAWPQVHDFVPPHYCGLLEEQCFPLQAWAVLPSFAELPPAAGPATEGFWALFQVSPSPTVSGSRSLNLYLPAGASGAPNKRRNTRVCFCGVGSPAHVVGAGLSRLGAGGRP